MHWHSGKACEVSCALVTFFSTLAHAWLVCLCQFIHRRTYEGDYSPPTSNNKQLSDTKMAVRKNKTHEKYKKCTMLNTLKKSSTAFNDVEGADKGGERGGRRVGKGRPVDSAVCTNSLNGENRKLNVRLKREKVGQSFHKFNNTPNGNKKNTNKDVTASMSIVKKTLIVWGEPLMLTAYKLNTFQAFQRFISISYS